MHELVGAADPTVAKKLVVAEDGSIPADQLAGLGLRPGAHLRVVAEDSPVAPVGLAGSLPDLPDMGWDAFKRASVIGVPTSGFALDVGTWIAL